MSRQSPSAFSTIPPIQAGQKCRQQSVHNEHIIIRASSSGLRNASFRVLRRMKPPSIPPGQSHLRQSSSIRLMHTGSIFPSHRLDKDSPGLGNDNVGLAGGEIPIRTDAFRTSAGSGQSSLRLIESSGRRECTSHRSNLDRGQESFVDSVVLSVLLSTHLSGIKDVVAFEGERHLSTSKRRAVCLLQTQPESSGPTPRTKLVSGLLCLVLCGCRLNSPPVQHTFSYLQIGAGRTAATPARQPLQGRWNERIDGIGLRAHNLL